MSEGNLPLSRRDWTIARFLAERSRAPTPPLTRASDDALHVAKLAVSAPVPTAVYVVDDDERYLGVITDARLAREVFVRLDPNLGFNPNHPWAVSSVLESNQDASRLPAGYLMESGIRALNENESLAATMSALYKSGRDELPVINEAGTLVGVIRTLDIIREWIEDTLQVRLGDETQSYY